VIDLNDSFTYPDETSIVEFGRLLLKGAAPDIPDYENNPEANVSILEAGNHDAIDKSVLDLYKKGFQILTLRQTGKFGADEVSERIHLKGLNRDCNFVIGDQVCVRRGTYHLNGYDIPSGIAGTIVDCIGVSGDKMLSVKFGSREAQFHERKWAGLAHTWASTIHVAQGSEWLDTAVILHQSGGRKLNSQVLYSAATCASRRFVVIGDRTNYTSAATSVGSTRHTGLSKLLQSSTSFWDY
jgi:ATP-dependent exoDNAse (exonuclease V) alpha subunit